MYALAVFVFLLTMIVTSSPCFSALSNVSLNTFTILHSMNSSPSLLDGMIWSKVTATPLSISLDLTLINTPQEKKMPQ